MRGSGNYLVNTLQEFLFRLQKIVLLNLGAISHGKNFVSFNLFPNFYQISHPLKTVYRFSPVGKLSVLFQNVQMREGKLNVSE